MSKANTTMTPIATPPLFDQLPSELTVNIMTYLRAYDLSALNQTCRFFASPDLVHTVIKHTAEHVYTTELTDGFEREGRQYTFESLRNMEWLVVARVLSRPEPSDGYYVSKSWCKTALKWLEVHQDEQKLSANAKKSPKKMSKKKQRMRNRRLSDASPPWPNVNSDLVCCHDNLQHCQSTKNARTRRRLLDKQAWKVLKKLYPDSVSLDSGNGECVHCRVEFESVKLEQKQRDDRQKEERRRPLSCPIVRGIYTRTRGVPSQNLEDKANGSCSLKSGIYHILPRAWLHGWRKYLKTGEGDRPCAPDASALLCHGHRLPLLPPHLEAYVYGETIQLLTSVDASLTPVAAAAATPPSRASRNVGSLPVGMNTVDRETWNALRTAGVSQQELDSQRSSFRTIHHQPPATPTTPSSSSLSNNELLDVENNVVVEILTDEEFTALEKWWPQVHSSYGLRFTLHGGDVSWSTLPCRDCDATGKYYHLSLRTRSTKKAAQKRAPAANLEY
jgi:hypothetical protein